MRYEENRLRRHGTSQPYLRSASKQERDQGKRVSDSFPELRRSIHLLCQCQRMRCECFCQRKCDIALLASPLTGEHVLAPRAPRQSISSPAFEFRLISKPEVLGRSTPFEARLVPSGLTLESDLTDLCYWTGKAFDCAIDFQLRRSTVRPDFYMSKNSRAEDLLVARLLADFVGIGARIRLGRSLLVEHNNSLARRSRQLSQECWFLGEN